METVVFGHTKVHRLIWEELVALVKTEEVRKGKLITRLLDHELASEFRDRRIRSKQSRHH